MHSDLDTAKVKMILCTLNISPEHTSEMNYDELSKGDKLAVKDVIGLSFDERYVWK